MEYFYYLLAILGVVGICLYLFRVPGSDEAAPRRANSAAERRQADPAPSANDANREQLALQRDLKNVPTPWGWPGSQMRSTLPPAGTLNGQASGESSGMLQAWIDRLVAEKRTVDDSEYLLRKDASLRALLEDRFGRSIRPGEIAYRKVKPPMLRDPSRPYDQEDNFPGGRTDQIVDKLKRQPDYSGSVGSRAEQQAARQLKDIKTPWGW